MGRVSTAEFLGMYRTEDGWTLPIGDRAVGGGRGSLFGGVGLAASVAMMEAETDRTAVWATTQYVATLFDPAELRLQLRTPAVGRSVTQCSVRGTSAQGDSVVDTLGAVGNRSEHARGSWEPFPDPIDPDESVDSEREFGYPSLHDHVEVRMARGMFGFSGAGAPSGDNRTLVWVRMRDVVLDAPALAIIADYGPSSVGNALAQRTNLSSLDNTIRYADAISEDDADFADGWVLCDNRVEFVGNGFAHSSSLLWSQGGRLLATASQSMTIFAV